MFHVHLSLNLWINTAARQERISSLIYHMSIFEKFSSEEFSALIWASPGHLAFLQRHNLEEEGELIRTAQHHKQKILVLIVMLKTLACISNIATFKIFSNPFWFWTIIFVQHIFLWWAHHSTPPIPIGSLALLPNHSQAVKIGQFYLKVHGKKDDPIMFEAFLNGRPHSLCLLSAFSRFRL